MSYARFSKVSDVYVYSSARGGIECCGCKLITDRLANAVMTSPAEMLDHLNRHVRAGHRVPEGALAQLREEARL